jgi:hypothetical protein
MAAVLVEPGLLPALALPVVPPADFADVLFRFAVLVFDPAAVGPDGVLCLAFGLVVVEAAGMIAAIPSTIKLAPSFIAETQSYHHFVVLSSMPSTGRNHMLPVSRRSDLVPYSYFMTALFGSYRSFRFWRRQIELRASA